MPEPMDPREQAFEALLAVAKPIRSALTNVDAAVAEEIEREAAGRAGWTSSQVATAVGYSRFCNATGELKIKLRGLDTVSYRSTPAQEASNLFLWQIGPHLTLRVKRDPGELHFHDTQPLFSRQASSGDHTVCLTWEKAGDETIRNVRFVSTHPFDAWSITLVELLAAVEQRATVQKQSTSSGVAVSSSKKQSDAQPASDTSSS